MRIAHVTATFPPYYAGTGNVCLYNARELARLGHDVTVLTANYPPGDYAYTEEITVRRLPVVFRLGNAPLLPHLAGISGADIIHLHLPFIFGAELTWLSTRRSGIPYVVTYHMDLHANDYRRPLFAIYQAMLLPHLLRDAALILPTTVDYAHASRLGPIVSRQPNKVVAMPNGVDTEIFHPRVGRRDLRSRYGLKEQDLVVLFVAALDRAHFFKGLDILLLALTRIEMSGVKALIVGEGELKTHYTKLAQSLRLSERVVFCGRVPQEQLPAHYALADCLVLPSTTMGEAFGMVLIEAMACGKPVIASNLPGVRAVVSDREDGLLVTPGDADDLARKMQALLADPQRRLQMGEHGRVKTEAKYAWPKIGRRLELVYQQVLSRN